VTEKSKKKMNIQAYFVFCSTFTIFAPCKHAEMRKFDIEDMNVLDNKIDHIKGSILKFVPARSIYLYGSHAYGNPTEKSDIDIYVVTPDDVKNFSELYAKIAVDLSDKKIFFIDLLMNTESVFNTRKKNNILEKTINQKGELIYEH
jgi:predicted nucleotidyltransferase